MFDLLIAQYQLVFANNFCDITMITHWRFFFIASILNIQWIGFCLPKKPVDECNYYAMKWGWLVADDFYVDFSKKEVDERIEMEMYRQSFVW